MPAAQVMSKKSFTMSGVFFLFVDKSRNRLYVLLTTHTDLLGAGEGGLVTCQRWANRICASFSRLRWRFFEGSSLTLRRWSKNTRSKNRRMEIVMPGPSILASMRRIDPPRLTAVQRPPSVFCVMMNGSCVCASGESIKTPTYPIQTPISSAFHTKPSLTYPTTE